MALTKAEKACGRWWRDQKLAELAADRAAKPDMVLLEAPISNYRHECPKLDGKSVGFEIKEVYILSPRLAVCYCSVVGLMPPPPPEPPGPPPYATPDFPHWDCDGAAIVDEGRLAFIYREGRCARCGLHAGSPSGRVVDAWERKPVGRASG